MFQWFPALQDEDGDVGGDEGRDAVERRVQCYSSGFGFRNLTTWFKSWFHHILAVWPQGSCLTSLSLFLYLHDNSRNLLYKED